MDRMKKGKKNIQLKEGGIYDVDYSGNSMTSYDKKILTSTPLNLIT